MRIGIFTWCSRKHLQHDSDLGGCFSSAWPAIWKWLQFLDDQCCKSSNYGPTADVQVRVLIAVTLRSLSHSASLRYIVASTPGVIVMITIRWQSIATLSHLLMLNSLMQPWSHMFSNCLPKLINAPGGVNSVAALTIEHLNTILAEKPTDLSTIYRQLASDIYPSPEFRHCCSLYSGNASSIRQWRCLCGL